MGLRKTAPKIAFAGGLYGALRYLRCPNDASKLLSAGAFGYVADQYALEFVTPFLLSPSLLRVLQRFGSHQQITMVVFGVSVGYMMLENLHTPDAVPRNMRRLMDKNNGTPREVMARFREDCSAYGWITKEFSNSCSYSEAAVSSIKSLSVNLGKLQLLSMAMKVALTRKLNVDIKRNVVSWARMVLFFYSCFMMTGGFIDQYNRRIHHFNDSQDIEQYRPSKAFQFTMFAFFSYICLYSRAPSDRPVLASIIFVHALVTRLNKDNIRLKAFLPIICYLFSRF